MVKSEVKCSQKRIGLLGGTFDPVHKGHLQIADKAAQYLNLDTVLFIPAAVPPHKPDLAVTSYSHRVRMIELALEDMAGMEISTIEQSLPTPSYTIDTLKAIKQSGKQEELFYIVGLDAFLEIDTWKSYATLLKIVNFIVLSRSGYHHTPLERFLQNHGYLKEKKGWCNGTSGKRIFFLVKEIMDVSSSMIRSLIQSNEDIHPFLPGSVAQYIEENGLYRS